MSGPSLCRQPLWLSLRHSCPAYSQLLYFNEKKKKGFPETILINHNGSLLRRQPPPPILQGNKQAWALLLTNMCAVGLGWLLTCLAKAVCSALLRLYLTSLSSYCKIMLCTHCLATCFSGDSKACKPSTTNNSGPGLCALPFMLCLWLLQDRTVHTILQQSYL